MRVKRPSSRSVCFLLALLVGLCAGVATADEESMPADDAAVVPPLRVMSFNVRYGSANDGPNSWQYRKELVIAAIRQFQPDLIGTQETLPFQAEYLSSQLPDYVYVGKSRVLDEDGDEQCGILFRRDRFDDLAQGHFWLSETPLVPGSKSWDSSLPRMATWVKLYDRQAGTALLLLNTHFDHRGREARRQSAALLQQQLTHLAPQLPVIVTGDFNAAVDSDPYNALAGLQQSTPLVDTYRQQHPEPSPAEGTFGGFVGNQAGPRIDWILVSPSFQVLEAAIVHWNQEGRYPSDHYPVTAVIGYPED